MNDELEQLLYGAQQGAEETAFFPAPPLIPGIISPDRPASVSSGVGEQPDASASSCPTEATFPPLAIERTISGGVLIENAVLSTSHTQDDLAPDDHRVSTSLPSPRSPIHHHISPNQRAHALPSAAGHNVLHRHSTHRDGPAAAHHVVHGFAPALPTQRQPSLRRTGSTGRPLAAHIAPLAPMRPTSVDRPRKPAPVAGHLSRHKDRFIPLSGTHPHIPEEEGEGQEDVLPSTEEDESEGGALVSIGDAFYRRAKNWGRISVYCTAEAYNRQQVEEVLSIHLVGDFIAYPEAVYLRTSFSAGQALSGEVFIMDYGVVSCWNLTSEQEHEVVSVLLAPCAVKPMAPKEVMVNTLSFHYSANEPPHIQNDIITINKRQAADHHVKLAISHALAQSSKLTVYEDRIGRLVEEVRHLPEAMAKYGEVHMSRRQVAKLMGKVFLQKSAVNLLSTVLDTPEYFWRAPDHLQLLYDKVCEYMELEERVEIVNSRFEIIQKMLNIWSEHSQRTHLSRLDVIVALLVLLEVVLAAAQVVGMIWHRTMRI